MGSGLRVASHWQMAVTGRTDLSLRSLPEPPRPIADGTISGLKEGHTPMPHTHSPAPNCTQLGRAGKEGVSLNPSLRAIM